ncbi:DUF1634 domain-containing protein [Weissella viridescens]|uniref:DUF1634 domain-containing protein n=2 Tax=Weissella viridescens TaxID=1629 RepID=A0A3P2RBX7_WEIVI|nr:DUF1634 domain-containing protein [Weissella viridescens]
MKQTQDEKNLAHMEVLIGQIMRIGVALALAAMLIGFVLLCLNPHANTQPFPTRLSGIWQGLITWQPLAWMMFGLLLLIFTPVLRVVVSIFAFAKIHDHLYVAITTLVLLILCVAIAYGYHAH